MSDNTETDALLTLADRIDEADERPIVIHHGAAAELRRLVAENKALKADAERYRWLRDNRTDYSLTQKDGYGGRELKGWEELDAAIDAARSKT